MDAQALKTALYAQLELRHGKALQQKISRAGVAICGLGGLGSNIAVCLARLGIGRLHIIDFDKVELSNLNRQQYAIPHLGRYKTDAMKEILSGISPVTEVIVDCVRLEEANLDAILGAESIICEAFDDAECKAMLVNAVLERYPETDLIAASGMAGMADANTIRTRSITPHFYLCGDGVSDLQTEKTLFSTRAMLCAAHQAHAVLQILANRPTF